MGRGKRKRRSNPNPPPRTATPSATPVGRRVDAVAPPPAPAVRGAADEHETLLSAADDCCDGAQNPHVWQRRWFQVLLAALVVFVFLAYVVPGTLRALLAVQSVLTPVLVGLALAYIVNPVLRFAGREAGIGRLAGTICIMLLALLLVAVLAVTAVPKLVDESRELARTLPASVERFLEKMDERLVNTDPVADAGPDAEAAGPDADADADVEAEADPTALTVATAAAEAVAAVATPDAGPETPPDASRPAADDAPAAGPDAAAAAPDAADATDAVTDGNPDAAPAPRRWIDRIAQRESVRRFVGLLRDRVQGMNGEKIAAWAFRSVDVGFGLVGTAVGFTSYLALAAVVIAFCFFFFSWKLDALLNWFRPFIPARSRDHTLAMLAKMDAAVSSFVRGRVIQSLVMMAVLVVGWWLMDVPYWFLLGVITGVLNLVPFLPAAGWLLALGLSVLSVYSLEGQTFTWGILLWPTVVYFVAQTLDGYVIEPIVQGKATNLDPLSVFLVVLVGGSLAGLLGMLLAIPAAACIKILMQELVLPQARQLAARH